MKKTMLNYEMAKWQYFPNLFLNGIFYFKNGSFLINCADCNVFYTFGSNLEISKQNLQ